MPLRLGHREKGRGGLRAGQGGAGQGRVGRGRACDGSVMGQGSGTLARSHRVQLTPVPCDGTVVRQVGKVP